MGFPLEELPVDHFQGAGRISGKESDNLRALLNRMREASLFGGYQVDPDNSDRFSSIAEAFAVADVNEPDGAELVFDVADGTYPTHIDFGSDHPIVINSKNYRGAVLTGEYTFSLKTGTTLRSTIRGASVGGNVHIKDGRVCIFEHCILNGMPFDYDPAGGTQGYTLKLIDCQTWGFELTESGPSSNTNNVQIIGGQFDISNFGGLPVSIENTRLLISNCTCDTQSYWYANTGPLIDLNGSGSRVFLQNVSFPYAGGNAVFANAGSAYLYAFGAVFTDWAGGQTFNFGSAFDTVYGAIKVESSTGPTSPEVGTIWQDLELNDILVWDGTYWGNGTIFRKNLLVDVGSAAVSHTSGWTVPTGAGVINTSANALKALTGASGATLYGISNGTDGDKFAESAALVKNSKAAAKQATIDVGSGDTIYVHSMTSTGTEGGTLAGSNDEDVRVVVYFTMPKTLPSV